MKIVVFTHKYERSNKMNRDWSNQMTGFGALINVMYGGGDVGQSFPQSDADDSASGALFIPREVTLARRHGEKVTFVTNCSRNCWFWEMPNGSRIYHFDSMTYDRIGTENGHTKIKNGYVSSFENGAGPCPQCGNPNTSGGTVAAKQ
jgi:hypothetical protein